MDRLPLKVLIAAAIVFLLGYIIILGYSVSTFASESVDSFFSRGWIADNTLILFCRAFLALHATALMLSFSLLFRPRGEESSRPFFKLVRSSLFIFLIMTGVGFFLQEVVAPQAENRQFLRRRKTALAREYREEADREEEAGRYAQALEALKRTIALIPGEREVLKDRIETLVNRLAENPPAHPVMDQEGPLEDMSARELLLQAQRFEDGEDLFSAYYYSSLALRIDPDLGEARAMASRIWTLLGTLVPDREDRERREIFDRKRKGTELLSEGRSIEAYYTFLDAQNYLALQNLPADPDIDTYLSLSRRETMKLAFFLSDTEELMVSPGYENIFFMNGEGNTPEGLPFREYIAFHRLVPNLPEKGSWMAEGVAIQGISSRGEEYGITASFAKILPDIGGSDGRGSSRYQGRLILRGLDSQNKGKPLYTPAVKGKDPPELLEGIMPFALNSAELQGLARETRGYLSQDILTLWQNRKIFPSLGVSTSSLDREIFKRLLYPFTFFIAALLSVTVGWRHRQRRGHFSAAMIILIPVLPLLLSLLEQIYGALAAAFTGFFLFSLGFGAAMIFTLLLQGILFLLSFLFLASQSSR